MAPQPSGTPEEIAAFARALSDLIDESLLSQREIAERLAADDGGNVQRHQTSISNWKNGKHEPSRPQVFALEAVFELPPGTLSRLLGYLPVVEQREGLLELIAQDTDLSAEQREDLARQYRGMVARTEERRRQRRQRSAR